MLGNGTHSRLKSVSITSLRPRMKATGVSISSLCTKRLEGAQEAAGIKWSFFRLDKQKGVTQVNQLHFGKANQFRYKNLSIESAMMTVTNSSDPCTGSKK